jgi:hypothetical protein
MGRKLFMPLLFGFFGIGITIEVFQIFGSFPVIIEKLKMCARGLASVSAQFFRNMVGISSGELFNFGFSDFRQLYKYIAISSKTI